MSDNKKILNATSLEFEGITFKSKLEVMAYKTLKENGINVEYEPVTFVVWKGFKPTREFYEKDKKTKDLALNDKKIIDIKYTPDFVVEYNGKYAYLELKGFQNDTYYLKKKLFRGYIEDWNLDVMYFEIHTKKELLQAIEIIKNKYGT